MPFEIVRNDITNMQVDAIVNTANPQPTIGFGVDAGIHEKAGPELLAARLKIGRIRVGDAAVTPAFNLRARYVIHTVGPVWRGGGHNEERLLRACYEHSLALAKKHDCKSVAFPLIAAGNYGFPPALALQIAMDAIRKFLMKYEMRVYLVVFDREAFQLSEKLFRGITSFIDENYILKRSLRQYGLEDGSPDDEEELERLLQARRRTRRELAEADRKGWIDEIHPIAATEWEGEAFPTASEVWEDEACPTAPEVWEETVSPTVSEEREKQIFPTAPTCPPKASAPVRRRVTPFKVKPSLAQLLAETDAGFSETLLKLIDRTGKKDSEVYTRANVSRQHFSKIRNNPDYKPTKTTAIAFAIALELDLEQTRDLIGRAGYALTNSSKFDVIIMYFIRERNYNMFDINAALFEFDQSLLGV